VPPASRICAFGALVASLLLSQVAVAAKVVVFGLDPRNVSAETTAQGAQRLLTTLAKLPGLTVIDPQTAKARLGVDLVQQARACEYDVFCLVELGELLDADTLLIGHLSRPAPTDPDADLGLELRLMVLEVASASTVDVLLWRVQDLNSKALAQACDAGARRLFGPPDIKVQFVLTPPNAQLHLYGEPVELSPKGAPIPYWSGTYDAIVRAEGYEPRQVRIRLKKGKATLTVPLELEQDPLWVGERASKPELFDRPSRSSGLGTLNLETPAVPQPSLLHRLLPWGLGGGGVVVSALGGFLMQQAQASYNTRAGEIRYQSTVTLPAAAAVKERDAAQGKHRIGSGLLVAGMVAIVGAGVWLILDTPAATAQSTKVASRHSPKPAVRIAARRLAQEFSQ
jgi:hypothetical protein